MLCPQMISATRLTINLDMPQVQNLIIRIIRYHKLSTSHKSPVEHAHLAPALKTLLSGVRGGGLHVLKLEQ